MADGGWRIIERAKGAAIVCGSEVKCSEAAEPEQMMAAPIAREWNAAI